MVKMNKIDDVVVVYDDTFGYELWYPKEKEEEVRQVLSALPLENGWAVWEALSALS